MNINPVFRFPTTEHWVTALLFLCVLLFAWVKTAYPKRVTLVFREVFTASFSDEDTGINLASIAMFIIFICCSALLVMQVVNVEGMASAISTGKEFLLIAAFFLFIYISKTLIILFSGLIFDEQQRAWEYLSEIYVFAHFLGLVLLPAALLVTYSSGKYVGTSLEIVFGAVAVLYVYRTIKMFILMTNKGLSMIYLFLYICALEILPYALLFKYAEMSLKI